MSGVVVDDEDMLPDGLVLLDEEVEGDVVVPPLLGIVLLDVVLDGDVAVDDDDVAGGVEGTGVAGGVVGTTTVVEEDVGGVDDDFGVESWRWQEESATSTLAATAAVTMRWFICNLLCSIFEGVKPSNY